MRDYLFLCCDFISGAGGTGQEHKGSGGAKKRRDAKEEREERERVEKSSAAQRGAARSSAAQRRAEQRRAAHSPLHAPHKGCLVLVCVEPDRPKRQPTRGGRKKRKKEGRSKRREEKRRKRRSKRERGSWAEKAERTNGEIEGRVFCLWHFVSFVSSKTVRGEADGTAGRREPFPRVKTNCPRTSFTKARERKKRFGQKLPPAPSGISARKDDESKMAGE